MGIKYTIIIVLICMLNMSSHGQTIPVEENDLSEKEIIAYNNNSRRKIINLGRRLTLLSNANNGISESDKEVITKFIIQLFNISDSVIVQDSIFKNEKCGTLLQYLDKLYYNSSRNEELIWDLVYYADTGENRIFRYCQINEKVIKYEPKPQKVVQEIIATNKTINIHVFFQFNPQKGKDKSAKIITKLGDISFRK